MSATNAFETSILGLFFTATAITSLATNATSTPATSLYISLHTADPGEAGTQLTSETTYTSYARVAVIRTAAGWTVSGAQVSNAGVITFPTCTGGSAVLTHFGIGLSASGSGTLLLKGALTASLNVSNGIAPRYDIGDLTTSVD